MSEKLVTVKWSWPGADEWPSSSAPSGLGVVVGLVGLELALGSHIEPESSHKKSHFDSGHPLLCFDLSLYLLGEADHGFVELWQRHRVAKEVPSA